MTSRLGSEELLAIGLGVVIVLLAGTFAWQVATYGAGDMSDVSQPIEPTELPEMPAVVSLPELAFDSYAEITERPVFSPSRRPPARPARSAAPRSSSARSVELELVGVVREGGRSVAMIRPRGSGETVRLAEGETHGNWTVAEIGADFVVVVAGGREQELRLAYKRQ